MHFTRIVIKLRSQRYLVQYYACLTLQGGCQLHHKQKETFCREAAATVALLDAAMEGLSDATSAGVREMCANVIRELFDWSMRQGSGNKPVGNSKQPEASSTAVLLMRGLFERLAHPEPYMRFPLAAVLPFCSTMSLHVSAGRGSRNLWRSSVCSNSCS